MDMLLSGARDVSTHDHAAHKLFVNIGASLQAGRYIVQVPKDRMSIHSWIATLDFVVQYLSLVRRPHRFKK
jgi:hypothetical protein